VGAAKRDGARVERRTSRVDGRTSNVERRTSRVERRDRTSRSNVEIERRGSNVDPMPSQRRVLASSRPRAPAPYLPSIPLDRPDPNPGIDLVSEDRPRDHGPFSLYAFGTAFVAVALVGVVVLVGAYNTCAFEGCPDIEQVQGYVPDEASVVLDRDEEEIGKLFRVNRVIVEVDSLPEHVTQAFIAVEDQDFYEHGGVDWMRAVGALWQNVRSAGIQEGFSTITMQVARNVFPEQLPVQERTLNRKISEIKVARQLEGRYTKEEILSLYLNQIYFGSGAWGIQAASQEYFGKPATELELGEAALLAGLPKAPSELNPRKNMDGALERRNTVLRRMVDQGFITEAEAEEVRADGAELARTTVEAPDRAAYFMEQVRQILEERLGDDIYTRGYTIHTTLDLDAQAVAERELREQLQAIESGRYGGYPHATYASTMADSARASSTSSPYLQGAVIVMAAESGDVLALVGGRDFDDSKFNRAIQARRQPGSAFKPFVYAAAIQGGYPPTTILQDTPYTAIRDGRAWSPRNYGGSYSGEITMREALVASKNVATIRLAEQVGLGRVIQMARSLGIQGDIPHYPSIAIGAAEVTLLELVAAYSAFATLGDRPEPRFITRVTDRNGHLVWQASPRSRHVLQSDVAFLTVDLMRDVVDRGTGAGIRSAGFVGAAAGKTGTTNESADVWFVGFTPEVTTGVWIGLDDPQRIMRQATGGRLAAPVWGRIMRRVGRNASAWTPPPGVEEYMVDEMGNVVASNCPTIGEVHPEYFLRGTVNQYDCQEYLMGYGDSLYADSAYGDGDSWWRRLRERLFTDEEAGEGRDTMRSRPDTIILETPPPDTSPRPRWDTTPDPDPPSEEPRDTIRLTPQPPDTTPRPASRDTLPTEPPPDTSPPPPTQDTSAVEATTRDGGTRA
jgi:penicillin-binding protein 1A